MHALTNAEIGDLIHRLGEARANDTITTADAVAELMATGQFSAERWARAQLDCWRTARAGWRAATTRLPVGGPGDARETNARPALHIYTAKAGA